MTPRVLSTRVEPGDARPPDAARAGGSRTRRRPAARRSSGAVPDPPYVRLWTRIRGFGRDALTGPTEDRRVVQATLMRATLHLMMAEDCLLLRPALQPALDRSLRSIVGKRLEGLDLDRPVTEAQTMVEEAPHTAKDIQARLAEFEPDRDPSASGLPGTDATPTYPEAACRHVGHRRQPQIRPARTLARGDPGRTRREPSGPRGPLPGGIRAR